MQKKAFNVNWSFLFLTLKKFGFGKSFIQWIRTLYTSPKATVVTNGIISQSFTLYQWTRQGCPFFSSLFAIFIEPLVALMQQNGTIQNFKNVHSEHEISHLCQKCAIISTSTSWITLRDIRYHYSSLKFSNYTVNWEKSTILPLAENSWSFTDQDNFSSKYGEY